MSLRLDGRNPLAYMGVNPDQPPQLVVNRVRPTANNTNFNLGTLWLIPQQDAPLNSMELWTLLSLTGNVATWVQLYPGSGGGGATSFPTDSGTASEVGGDLNIFGGSNIGTTGSGNTVTVNLDNTVSISGSLTAGTGITATTGNIVATAGQVNAGTSISATTTVTAGTGVQVTTGDVGLLAGNVTLPATNTGGTQGMVKINGTRFISNYNNTTAVGNNSGNLTSTGLFGAAFGNSALTSLTSGASNNAFGNGALQDCTTGGNNNCFGYTCGSSITTGSRNTAAGDGCIAALTTGNDNCAYGDGSLSQLVSGSNNISIGGTAAGTAYTGAESSNIVIGNTGTGAESNAIHIGTQGSGAGQQNKAYMAGIYQASVGGTNEFVIIDNTGKLGSTAELVVDVAHGGTGLTSITTHDLLIGNGTSALILLAPSATAGIPLVSAGAAADPAYGTAVVAGGGTGDTSFTAYAVITGGTTSTGALQNVSGVGTSGQVLTSNGAAALPSWQASGSGSSKSFLGTGGSAVSTIAQSGALSWMAPYGIISTDKASRQFVVPVTGTISKLYVNATTNGSTTNVSFTLNVNGVNSALVATATALTTGVFSDLTHTVSVNAGDTIQFECQAATTNAIQGIISAMFTA